LHKIIVIGLNDTSRNLVSFLREKHFNHDIVGILAEKGNLISIYDNPVYKLSLPQLESFSTQVIHEIYSTLSPSEIRKYLNLSDFCRHHGIRLHWVNRFSESIPYPVYLNNEFQYAVYSELREPLLLPENRILKRSFDVLISSLLIIFCLSWMIPVIGCIILLESRGPIFFRQKRTGVDNQTFDCLKFRTMKVNDVANEKQAEKNDARVTRFGRFLRHSSIDEFPQLLNVFVGTMSIVGPRPHMLKHTEDYSSIFGSYRVRHYVKPGITGWAQINGCRGEISHPDHLKARIVRDLWYIEHWSIGLDCKILWLTFYKMIKGDKQAY
jgi:putative colanic acid biosynthesis UDP-glucose lipid carrier transferase